MRISELFERYFCVRTCVGCGERMGYEYAEEAFCDACRIGFERAKTVSCPDCLAAMSECRCIPKSLSSAGVLEYRKLVAYLPSGEGNPENKLLYFLKRNRNKRTALFVAKQLLYKLEEVLAENGVSREDAVLTYVPRSYRSYVKYGVDQSEIIVKMLSRVSGIEYLCLVQRKISKGREQKSLRQGERIKNAEKAFLPNDEFVSEYRGKAVFIFDDIVTSGASVAAAAKILKGKGITRIYALSVAYSVKEKSGANFIFR